MLEKLDCFYSITKFKDHELVKEKLLKAIDTAKFMHLDNPLADCDITKTDWIHSEDFTTRPWVSIFKDHFLDHLDDVYGSMGYSKYHIHQLWFQQYSTLNSRHCWHAHGCNFTNVYYLELPEGSPKTQYVVPYGQQSEKIVKEFDIKEGDVLVFPSFVLHRAPPLQDDIRKTIISFNVNVEFGY